MTAVAITSDILYKKMSHLGTYILAEQQERNHAVPYHDAVNENSMETGKRKPIQYGKKKGVNLSS